MNEPTTTQNVMANIRKIVDDSGLTQQIVGEKMGYPPKSARQSVSQFLKGDNPSLAVVVRFANAMGLGLEELLEEKEKEK